MTKLRTGKKAHTLSGAAALIIAAFLTLLFTGCPNSTQAAHPHVRTVW